MNGGWVDGWSQGGMNSSYLAPLLYSIFVFSDWQLHTMITILSHAGPNESDANHSHPTSLSQSKGNYSPGLEKTKLQQPPSGSRRHLIITGWGELGGGDNQAVRPG